MHSVLLGFGGVVFPLAGVPQQQGDSDGGQGHDPEGCPVQLRKTKGLFRVGGMAQGGQEAGARPEREQPGPRFTQNLGRRLRSDHPIENGSLKTNPPLKPRRQGLT